MDDREPRELQMQLQTEGDPSAAGPIAPLLPRHLTAKPTLQRDMSSPKPSVSGGGSESKWGGSNTVLRGLSIPFVIKNGRNEGGSEEK